MPNAYRIIRKDLTVDPVIIESEGLSIGRATNNDIVLNHPTVSRLHAGIKAIGGDFWISNLSEANGTLLNGELVDDTPLADGDVVQIGPFFLRPAYAPDGLQIEVEMTVSPLPLAASSGTSLLRPPDAEGKTARLDLRQLAQVQKAKATMGGTQRLSGGTGRLTGRLTQSDAESLKVFWAKRLREQGKVAELIGDSPLKPKRQRLLGKAQFNWRPTRDLQWPWRKSLFVWAALIVSVLAVVAAFAFTDAYSPRPLSTAHHRRDLAITPAIAKNPNAGSCTTCHAVAAPMQQNCAACHTTPAFHSEVSQAHLQAGLTCLNCHDEHHGRNFRPAQLANAYCVNCHRDGGGVIAPSNGKPLGTPHGGTFGYPVNNGRWGWPGISQPEWKRKELPGTTASYSLKEQFHLVHVAGRQQGRSLCSDCHTAGFEGAALTQGVRASCAQCHGTSAELAQAQHSEVQTANRDRDINHLMPTPPGGPLCVTCHTQHGEEKELRASLRRMERTLAEP